MKASSFTLAALGALLVLASGAGPAASAPVARSAATCADYDNQADAQRNADTRDADSDGIYCEALPCPCLRGSSGGSYDDGAAERRRGVERRAVARRRAAARRRATTRREAAARRRATVRRQEAARRAAERRRATARRREESQRRSIENPSWVVYDVVDGDTVKVRAGGRRETVRLIGIDTPETSKPNTDVECGGLNATSHMLALTFPAPADSDGDGLFDRENAVTGVGVTLTTDRTQGLRDSFGRLLAYVSADSDLPHARTRPYDLGREMLLAGWATVYEFEDGFRRLSAYTDAEIQAQDADIGVHSACDGDFHAPAG